MAYYERIYHTNLKGFKFNKDPSFSLQLLFLFEAKACFLQRIRMASELASTEEVVNALLEYLVGPRLPLKSSAFKEAPSLSQQQSVAKQLHAVVLLYNYYQRKQNPQAQYLDFESFCKLAITLKPALMSYMKFMNQSNPTASKDMKNDHSVTEKAIQDACNISCSLDASKDVPSINKWLISKVSVLLLDSKKETCLLLYSSVTEGVWSLLEKCLELPSSEIEGMVERKKSRTSMKPVIVEQEADDSGFQKLAFLVVKDATGISKSDLVTLEKHVVYSLTKEKTASCFYIMQCIKSIDQDIQIPLKEIFESLQGPLVKRSAGSWSATEVVEYFHLLPYASIISTFFLSSRKDITDKCEKEISESRISLFDQNLGNVSIMTAICSESACSNVVNDMHDRNANPADSFSAEEVANNDCERSTGDQKDFGKENGGHHHHETVRAYGSLSGKAKEASPSKGSPSVEKKIEKMKAKTPDESYEALIGTKSDHVNLEISEAKKGDGCDEKVGHSVVGQGASKRVEEKTEAKAHDGSCEALSGTKSDSMNLEIPEAKKDDGFHEKVGEEARLGVEETIEKMKAKTPDESCETLIGAKSDHINLEISDAKYGDGCHEKVGQVATGVGDPYRIRKREEAGRESLIINTEIADLSNDMLTGVDFKFLNDTSNKVNHENSRNHEDSTVKVLHAIINHTRTPEEKTEELVMSTKGCETNDYNDMELAGSRLEPLEVKINDDYHLSSSPTRPQRMDTDACIACSRNGNNIKDSKLIKETYRHQKKRTRESGGGIIGSGIICKAQRTDEVKADKEHELSTISPNQNGISVVQTGLLPCKHESTYIGDLQTVLASKQEALTKSSIDVLLHKRQKLYHQLLEIEDEIAVCDKNIQRILEGGKDSLVLKLETLLDFCDEMCLKDRASIQEDGPQPHDEFGLIQPMSGRKLSKAVRYYQMCHVNNWMFLLYSVSATDGGFYARVTKKGVGFLLSCESDLHSSPSEAQESAVFQMITQ
ncbi:unnamed protein product [Withania somnifera]